MPLLFVKTLVSFDLKMGYVGQTGNAENSEDIIQ